MDLLDVLKSEINRKRKQADELSGPNKYIKRSDIEKKREEEYRLKYQQAVKPVEEPVKAKEDLAPPELEEIAEEELLRRFRAKSQPIRLFGETQEQRIRRLKRAEQAEVVVRQNGLRDVRAKVEQETHDGLLRKESDAARRKERWNGIQKHFSRLNKINLDFGKTKHDDCCVLLEAFFKKLLYEWEDELDSRSMDEKLSEQGKQDTVTFVHSVSSLEPLFKMLETKKLPNDVFERLVEIAHWIHKREYVKANDAYLRMSIGNACWPMGVTATGIHARQARSRIAAEKVAHVLNDEVQRKWVQGIKRLMTFAQQKYPPDDFAKQMG